MAHCMFCKAFVSVGAIVALAGSVAYFGVRTASADDKPGTQPEHKTEVKPVTATPAATPAATRPADGKAEMKGTATVDGKYESADGKEMLSVAERHDVVFTIQVEDLKVGTGEEVKPGATVSALYHGQLKDGTVFDSTRKRNDEPTTFPLSGVIPGWTYGLPGMKVGGIRRLTIPYVLAYGERGRPGIPPRADLIFTIEMKSVQNPAEAAPASK